MTDSGTRVDLPYPVWNVQPATVGLASHNSDGFESTPYISRTFVHSFVIYFSVRLDDYHSGSMSSDDFPVTAAPGSLQMNNPLNTTSNVANAANDVVPYEPDTLRCSRCKHSKPIGNFKRGFRILKQCERCRAMDMQREKRRYDLMHHGAEEAYGWPVYENYYQFIRDLKKVLIRYPTTSEGEGADDATTYRQVTNAHFVLGNGFNIPTVGVVGYEVEKTQETMTEPKELFAAIIDAIYETTGYYFIRRYMRKNEVSCSFKVYYVCSRLRDKSNMPDIEFPTRKTNRRLLFDCGGNLSMNANFKDLTVSIAIRHNCIHIPAERQASRGQTTRSALVAYNQTPHPKWPIMKQIFTFLGSQENEINRPLHDYILDYLGGDRFIYDFRELVAACSRQDNGFANGFAEG
ncbi:hypothetical protein V1507DRAFT_460348 [Lipomyces tetrasporus]